MTAITVTITRFSEGVCGATLVSPDELFTARSEMKPSTCDRCGANISKTLVYESPQGLCTLYEVPGCCFHCCVADAVLAASAGRPAAQTALSHLGVQADHVTAMPAWIADSAVETDAQRRLVDSWALPEGEIAAVALATAPAASGDAAVAPAQTGLDAADFAVIAISPALLELVAAGLAVIVAAPCQLFYSQQLAGVVQHSVAWRCLTHDPAEIENLSA